MPPSSRKPPVPIDDRPTSPARPSAKEKDRDKDKAREAFIGNDAATMMAEETFEEFEARLKREGEAATIPSEEP